MLQSVCECASVRLCVFIEQVYLPPLFVSLCILAFSDSPCLSVYICVCVSVCENMCVCVCLCENVCVCLCESVYSHCPLFSSESLLVAVIRVILLKVTYHLCWGFYHRWRETSRERQVETSREKDR